MKTYSLAETCLYFSLHSLQHQLSIPEIRLFLIQPFTRPLPHTCSFNLCLSINSNNQSARSAADEKRVAVTVNNHTITPNRSRKRDYQSCSVAEDESKQDKGFLKHLVSLPACFLGRG